MRTILLGLVMGLAVGQAKEFSPVAVFPSDWMQGDQQLYPLKKTPPHIQWQAWLAVKSVMNHREPILIEEYGPSDRNAEKLARYLVETHKFPQNRFIVVRRNNRNNVEDLKWRGWVVLRPPSVALPAKTPVWDIPIKTSRSAPLPNSALRMMDQANRVQSEWALGQQFLFRPAIGLRMFSVDRFPLDKERYRAAWMGFRAQGDGILIKTLRGEMGIRAQYFGSVLGMNQNALDTSTSEALAHPYLTFHPPASRVFGEIKLRVHAGYYGNWRGNLPQLRGLQIGGEAYATFDTLMDFGVSAEYTFAQRGLVRAGFFIGQQVFGTVTNPWQIRIGGSLSRARFDSAPDENWGSLDLSLVNSL